MGFRLHRAFRVEDNISLPDDSGEVVATEAHRHPTAPHLGHFVEDVGTVRACTQHGQGTRVLEDNPEHGCSVGQGISCGPGEAGRLRPGLRQVLLG